MALTTWISGMEGKASRVSGVGKSLVKKRMRKGSRGRTRTHLFIERGADGRIRRKSVGHRGQGELAAARIGVGVDTGLDFLGGSRGDMLVRCNARRGLGMTTAEEAAETARSG
jgi:hypothetical protein